MKTLILDTKYRVVTVNTLEAMCAHVSGVHCHTFRVEKVTRSRVHVSYSNEDEYGIECPITAVFPCYESPGIGTVVVLDALRYLNEQDSEDWQYFERLRDCPPIYRRPETGEWREYPRTNASRAVSAGIQAALQAASELYRLGMNGTQVEHLRLLLNQAMGQYSALEVSEGFAPEVDL